MASVTYDHVVKRYTADLTVVKDFNVEVKDKELMVLVGPSGCGKSTALRMLAGLEAISEGEIRIGDRVVNNVAAKDRDIAMVFQSYALYPHMSVYDNMAFPLQMQHMKKADIDKRVRNASRILGLDNFLARKPKALSGGERQRVAMGRAIVRSPQVFLMDEPLSNLDAKLRVQTRTQIAALQRRLGTTTVYVTHDQVEAMTMGDRVAVLKDGILAQCDTPLRLYQQPASVFVAGFIGSPGMNIAEFKLDGTDAVFGQARVRLTTATLTALADEGADRIVVGFRPESVDLVTENNPDAFPVTVAVVEELGSDAFLHGWHSDLPGSDATGNGQVIARVDPNRTPAKGERVYLRIQPGKGHFFSVTTAKRLPS